MWSSPHLTTASLEAFKKAPSEVQSVRCDSPVRCVPSILRAASSQTGGVDDGMLRAPRKKQERECPSKASTGDSSISGQQIKDMRSLCFSSLACSIFPLKV